ncbi:MAG: SDR family oxidoreductase, partial [Candidatus Puniceispirillaceae bacterium]
ALVVWTKKNRWTWRDRGIRMNAVSPGPVETPILKDFVKTLGKRAEEDMSVNDRAGRPDDIAPVVCFLLSDMTHWFRGANLMLDGGMSSHIYQNMHQF